MSPAGLTLWMQPPVAVTINLTALAIILAVAFGPPILFAMSVTRAKRYRREPSHAVRKAFLWGAIAAAGMALVLNTLLSGQIDRLLEGQEVLRPYRQHEGFQQIVLALVIAPVVEESAKALGIVALASLRHHTDEVVDGIIYGAVIGLGFSATENLFYEVTALATGGQGAYIVTAVARTFSSSLLHATATAVTGYGMGRWLSGRSRVGFFAAVPWWFVAVLMHAAFNAIAFATVVITIFPLIILALFAFSKLKKRITQMSLVAPHKDWKPIGGSRRSRLDDDAQVRSGGWIVHRDRDEPEHWVPQGRDRR